MYEMKFAEMLCTRLCHDLTGPIGALANGAEFLGEEGFDMQGQAVELIASSAAQAVARLQFYRRAYGRINDSGEASLSEMKKLVEDFIAGGKTSLDWPDTNTDALGIPVSYKMGRILINLIVIGMHSLLRGGTIAVRITLTDSVKEVRVTCTGAVVKWDKAIEDVLAHRTDPSALTPKTIQAELTRGLAEELDATLGWQVQDTSLDLTVRRVFSLPQATDNPAGI